MKGTHAGIVVSTHLALFAIAARPTGDGYSVAPFLFGALSVVVLAASLFYEFGIDVDVESTG
ncbi:hypothetical protein RYH80_01620 [Halobaculum sp. MBLA0147]|uniref:hypothetical protein n=1 Tax=Halobaculum sp. MBLA0147 TaxID=3079934 RepID=UPI003524DAB7